MFTYHDAVTGEQRIKRRYVWAFWGFAVGALVGIMVTEMLT